MRMHTSAGSVGGSGGGGVGRGAVPSMAVGTETLPVCSVDRHIF